MTDDILVDPHAPQGPVSFGDNSFPQFHQRSTHRHPTTRPRTLRQAAGKIFVNVYRHGISWPETHNKQDLHQNNTFSL